MVSIAPTHEGCSVLAGQGWQPATRLSSASVRPSSTSWRTERGVRSSRSPSRSGRHKRGLLVAPPGRCCRYLSCERLRIGRIGPGGIRPPDVNLRQRTRGRSDGRSPRSATLWELPGATRSHRVDLYWWSPHSRFRLAAAAAGRRIGRGRLTNDLCAIAGPDRRLGPRLHLCVHESSVVVVQPGKAAPGPEPNRRQVRSTYPSSAPGICQSPSVNSSPSAANASSSN